MALRWIEGFETWGHLGDGPGVWGDTFYGKYSPGHCDDGFPALVPGYRGIGLGYDVANTVYNHFAVPLDTQPTLVVGFAYYVKSGIYYYGEHIVSFRYGNTSQLWLEIQRDKGGETAGTHELFLFRGNTFVASLGYYPANEWIYVEMKATIHNTNGSYEIRVRGVPVAAATGVDTADSANDYADTVVFGYTNGIYDDIYILDGTSGLNDFLGEMKVEKGMPASDDSTQWTRTSGSANYENVDEIPTSETDYIHSKTQNHVDLFAVDACGSSRIKGAQLNVDTTLSVPGTKELILLCDSNGHQQAASEQVGEADNRIIACMPTEIDPDTGLAWTQSGINAARWGVKVG